MKRVYVPVRPFKNDNWADLNSLGLTHEICGEQVHCKDQKFTFLGGHRVRLYQFKKNVHWKVPAAGQVVDISEVPPASAPARKQR
jgi:hypothetical protein